MVNWLVIGIGDITRKRVIPAILSEPRCHLHSILTRDPAKAAVYPGVRVTTTLEEALQNDDIDAVYVASPVYLHAAQTLACLRAGKHVLCEKPFGMNLREAQSMTKEAQEHQRMLGVAYYRRLYPKLIRAKQLIATAAIGQPTLVQANCHGWLESPDRAWLQDPAMAGGGPLYDIGSHRIDASNFLFGKPLRATGHLSNAVHQLAVEDSATTLIDYANGIRAIIDVRWNSHVARDQFRIIGTDGEINLDPLNGPTLKYKGREEFHEEHLAAHPNVHYPLVENFVNAITQGIPLACPADEALWTDQVTQWVKDNN